MGLDEVPPAPEQPKGQEASNFHVTANIRASIEAALQAETKSPMQKRLLRLNEKLESGEIVSIRDGEWIAQAYQLQQSTGNNDPVITSADIGNHVIVITVEQMRDIIAISYIDTAGALQVFDDQMMDDAGLEVLVIFPDEVGN